MTDEYEQKPIPAHWRQTFRDVVAAFVASDYQRSIPGVRPLSAETASHIRRYILDYGTTLVALPEETWNSSVCSPSGDHWDALIDLWTREEGRSDLVLHAQVFENPTLSVEVYLVYVP